MATIPIITTHGRKRIAQRNGIQSGSASKIIRRVWKHGINHADAINSLKKYMDATYLKYKHANNIKFYGNSLYIFHNDVLITTLTVYQNIIDNLEDNIKPDAYKKYMLYKQSKRRCKYKNVTI